MLHDIYIHFPLGHEFNKWPTFHFICLNSLLIMKWCKKNKNPKMTDRQTFFSALSNGTSDFRERSWNWRHIHIWQQSTPFLWAKHMCDLQMCRLWAQKKCKHFLIVIIEICVHVWISFVYSPVASFLRISSYSTVGCLFHFGPLEVYGITKSWNRNNEFVCKKDLIFSLAKWFSKNSMLKSETVYVMVI